MSSSPMTRNSKDPQWGPKKWSINNLARAKVLSHMEASRSVRSGGSSEGASPVSISSPGVRPTSVTPKSPTSGARSSPICEMRPSEKRTAEPSHSCGSTSGLLSSQVRAAPFSPSSPSARSFGGCVRRSAPSMALMSCSTSPPKSLLVSVATTAKPLLARALTMQGPTSCSGCPRGTSKRGPASAEAIRLRCASHQARENRPGAPA
mmetsp:Transcript_44169/g.140709  ORF Transcript_44169/g.140709 Transcript_44169/m.140709 type:complete len:206 (+) Transcript_44169:393-1010(+)